MQLVIVRRSQFAAFGLLSQAFAEEADVRLIWDRRIHDRRRQSASQPVGVPRGRDRRRDPSPSWEESDYMVITRRADGVLCQIQQEAITSGHPLRAVESAGRDVRQDLEAAVQTDINVLITRGDPVSRELLARRIHRRSERRDRPFVVLDPRSAAGMFGGPALEGPCECLASEADQSREWPKPLALAGTLLIEEVADLTWEQQTELLSYLERRALRADGTGTGTDTDCDPRIITASRHLLFDRIASTEFRPDLFYRLNLIHVVFPAGTLRSS